MNRPNLLLAPIMALMLASPIAAHAQQGAAGAVLMVEDEGWPGSAETERLGVLLYGRILSTGPYSEVRVVKGRDDGQRRLAAAIRTSASKHRVVDVFLTVHTTTRDPASWANLVGPEAARKLRLVYSTACFGAEEERRAWETLGVKTVITHVGVNNPLIAFPYFLSRWLQGAPVGATVAEGYRETRAISTYVLSLPMIAPYGLAGLEGYGDPIEGSRPVVSGNHNLRITDGLARSLPALPRPLHYSRQDGGPLGLVLRAVAGRYTVERGGIATLLSRLELGALPIPAAELAKAKRLAVQWEERTTMDGGSSRTGRAEVELELRDEIKVPLDDGFELKVSKTVKVRPGVFDIRAQTLALHVSGLWVTKGLLRVALSRLTIKPDAHGPGYAVKANAGLFGVIPVWKTLSIGGRRPALDDDRGPIFLAPHTGMVDRIERVVR